MEPVATKKNPFTKIKPKFVKTLVSGEHGNDIDVREDLEQSEKLQEIIDILVAAGYFRARIKNLSSFDKVVGGMTWCIEFCNVEVDVDLLFQENSTIGQKIALTEKIVAVLPEIQCPHPIEPHQIQGLDFIHIFPVIEWLVKRSMEFRKQAFDFCYSYAVNQFDKHFSQRCGFTEKQQQMLKHIKMVGDVYEPRRVFKRKDAIPLKDIYSKVQLTLLEYGYKGAPPPSESENDSSFQVEGKKMAQIMETMDLINKDSLDYENLPEDRGKISEHYQELKKEFRDSDALSNDENKISYLKEKKEVLIDSLKKLKSKKMKIQEKIEDLKDSVSKIKLEQADVGEAMKRLEPDEKDSEKFKEVERLLLHGDDLDKQKKEFEEHCQKESLRLQTSIESLEKKSVSAEAKYEEFHSRSEEEYEKLKVLRLQVAKKNRAISILQRRIDEVPSRAELAQYQKRFIELYNQISAKHKETKQYYSLYNTLEDTRQYMKKELSLLNSIIDNYPEAMRSKEGKEEFLQQFLNILEGVKQSKLKMEKRLSQEKRKRDELSDSLHGYIEINRKYAAAIKVLKIEFQKNEEIIKNYM
ncbi:coiled-coil domain-containing protein 93 [Coccinella septempunctata]|uniref:coiled-coil domain-containing protein 93 n=1 Tax=Coccinella septempunctata TaxID=41139 RepID=UPI001D0932AA|nr:coiled-coil domain-containing protein 93 [Coccinella septempunctata]